MESGVSEVMCHDIQQTIPSPVNLRYPTQVVPTCLFKDVLRPGLSSQDGADSGSVGFLIITYKSTLVFLTDWA